MKHLTSKNAKKNNWWKYLLMLALFPVLAQLVVAWYYLLNTNEDAVGSVSIEINNSIHYASNPTVQIGILALFFIFMLIAFAFVYSHLHHKSFRTVINGTRLIRWRRIIIGFAICFVVEAFLFGADYYLDIDNYEVRLHWNSLIPLGLVAVFMVPFQAFFDEIIFRGYLAQGVAHLTKSRFLVILIPTIFFAVIHAFNPILNGVGFWTVLLLYFLIGLSYAIISVLDDGIELAMGLHAANNVFATIFVVNANSIIKTDALLLMKEVNFPDAFVPIIIAQLVMIAALAFKYKWPWRSVFSQIEDGFAIN
ncbi:CPBP family intramembrane glutamic endopeptidase [Carboxylicivirga sp. M1479]|uniref:CPBP family intramembrane glutamic endopeptidase n=1 Tax=Carboxylicivirga sp. M1479 TaxID=2594476 RepID=UPI0011774B61|nr:CPBP family intramembrane glutamic endopeptidase [Carboxylicivirga sp. M1479]TRX70313.1 CPBP family intramembrane metalloprotease [Carboxylicivirga sp. M1479]